MSLIEDDRQSCSSVSVYETAGEGSDTESEPVGFHTPRQGSPQATFLSTNKGTRQLELQLVDSQGANTIEQLINRQSNPNVTPTLVRGSASFRSPSLRPTSRHRATSSLRSASLPSRRASRRLSSPITPKHLPDCSMGHTLSRSRETRMGGSSPLHRNSNTWEEPSTSATKSSAQRRDDLRKQIKKARRGRRGRGKKRWRKALEAAIGQEVPSTFEELATIIPEDFNLDVVTYEPRRRRKRKSTDEKTNKKMRTMYMGALKERAEQIRENRSQQSHESQETLPFDTT